MSNQPKNTEYALEMRQVSKRFPGTLAVDKVDFRVKRGEVHALMGENGAGKSTLMKMLNGLFKTIPATFTSMAKRKCCTHRIWQKRPVLEWYTRSFPWRAEFLFMKTFW